MKSILNIGFLIVASVMLSSCYHYKNDLKEYYGREGMLTNRPMFMGKMPQGDDSYSQGVRDGCNTSLSIAGTSMLSTAYDDSYVDPDKNINDADYYKGKSTGANYCLFYLDPEPF